MQVESIQLINFKNYEDIKLDLNNRVTCVVGDNGMGKTNLLDAVYYTCLSKSYFNSTEQHNIRTGQSFFSIKMHVLQSGKRHELFCNYVAGEKKVIKNNKKPYTKIADHIGQFPCVMITPGDLYLINEYAQERRKFIDSIIVQYDAQYLNCLLKYHKILNQRNALLRSAQQNGFLDIDLIQIFDMQLAELGTAIFEQRKIFIQEYVPLVESIYSYIAQDREHINCQYKSSLDQVPLIDALAKELEKDKITGRTGSGVHKDDFLFLINDMPVKKYGSQGQQKSFVFALKLAKAKLIARKSKKHPILLLDDIFDRLDLNRMKNLMALIFEQTFGHIILSDTEAERITTILGQYNIDFDLIRIHEAKQILGEAQ